MSLPAYLFFELSTQPHLFIFSTLVGTTALVVLLFRLNARQVWGWSSLGTRSSFSLRNIAVAVALLGIWFFAKYHEYFESFGSLEFVSANRFLYIIFMAIIEDVGFIAIIYTTIYRFTINGSQGYKAKFAAMALTSILFALAHIPTSVATLVNFFVFLFMSLNLYLLSGTIFYSLIFHIINNIMYEVLMPIT